MRKILMVIYVLSLSTIGIAQQKSVDSLLTVLDKAIEQKPIYMQQKENRIDSLKALLPVSLSSNEHLTLIQKIYDEYKTFQYDSAFQYIVHNFNQSKKLHNTYWFNQSCLDLSFILTSSGLYNESLKFLEQIKRDSLTQQQQFNYYSFYARLYHDLSLFGGNNIFYEAYWNKVKAYQDSVISCSEITKNEKLLALAKKETFDKNYDKAKTLYLQFIENNKNNYSQDYSIAASTLSFIYSVDGETLLQKKYIILSAISDIHCAITENASFHRLAQMLYEEGNTEKAYQCIKLSLNDANYYNSRLRRIEIAKSLPIIEQAFHEQLNREKRRLTIALILISLLALVILIAAFYIFKQLKELRRNRLVIQNTNNQLKHLNDELLVSNKIKEEYIGHFLNLCSQYIDKIEQFQQLVQRKITVGQIDSLLTMSKSKKLINDEMQELLMSFDRIFLKLFPDFIDKFNTLFDDEEQFKLKKDEMLNTELRIFALIRLGINDSSKIAKFLRYSVNTVYTYRTKVKNQSKINRSDFEDQIMKIDSFKP